MDWYGYTGNNLYVNLNNKDISVSQQNIEDIKKFVGGLGTSIKLAANLIKSNTNPFNGDNYIIIGWW